ncbi:MAG: hypothetical protein PHO94_01525 [Petrimonas sp.]|nr:hypothetical protein [Petrimonas sp.]
MKLFKNKEETHGGILEEYAFNSKNRTFDLMLNGGLKGLKQYLINEDGVKKDISDKEIVGLRFYARIWLPANTSTGYVFIHKYNDASLKPLFDEIINEVLFQHKYILAGKRTVKTTTTVRQKEFLKKAGVQEITVAIMNSPHDTGAPNTTSATIRLKNLKIDKKKIKKEDVETELKKAGIDINTPYTYQTKYKVEVDSYSEEKTVRENNTFDLIPNILIAPSCIDDNNHPIFEKMQTFVSEEMEQIIKEAKSK